MKVQHLLLCFMVLCSHSYAEDGDLKFGGGGDPVLQPTNTDFNIGGTGDKQSQQAIGVPVSFISSDSEGFNVYKVGAQYLPLYQHGDNYTGVSYQFNKFTQNQWSAEGNQLGLTSKSINPRTALGYIANINANSINGHTLLTTDSYFGFNATSTTRAEFFINRDA